MTDYSLLSFVMRGEKRLCILKSLSTAKIPKQLAIDCGMSIHNVSKALKPLLERGLVSCKNPKDKFYRFYELTKKGFEILKDIKE